MPEYLAPGVYVEETSFRSKSIEGVSTTTTGFIGPCRYGPIDLEPELLTSLGEFERAYGGREKLEFQDGAVELDNYLWHAARAFFEEGGKRLYVCRVFRRQGADSDSDGVPDDTGIATGLVPTVSPPDGAIQVRARFPGRAGNFRVRFTLKRGENILASEDGVANVRSILNREVVWIGDVSSPTSSPPGAGAFYLAEWDSTNRTWNFRSTGSPSSTHALASLDPSQGHEVRIITVTVSVAPKEGGDLPLVWSDLPLDPKHERAGSPDSVFARFAVEPASRSEALTLPIVVEEGDDLENGLDVIQALLTADDASSPATSLQTQLEDPDSTDDERTVEVVLSGGNDGDRPSSTEYEGEADPTSNIKTGLRAFEDLEDISIVAAPGSTFGYENGYRDDAQTIVNLLIRHAERMRYRIAVLDSGEGQSLSQVRAMRARIDSSHAAIYYPWIRILDPVTRREVHLPPSGFVAGIYARNDISRAVYKAPANEVVGLALGFEKLLNKSQQDVLNPEGINCFRFFEGRGFRLWGARTVSSDPEWKYVNLRRYFAYLERSVDKGTQWAVFEPNGERLWANVRRTISDFLLNEWQQGALLGDKPEKAYFVKCDRTTMSQNDLDNGRLVCLIGVAPLRPAEFVIFRIGQWTADAKV